VIKPNPATVYRADVNQPNTILILDSSITVESDAVDALSNGSSDVGNMRNSAGSNPIATATSQVARED
jgi:hypothetical protein